METMTLRLGRNVDALPFTLANELGLAGADPFGSTGDCPSCAGRGERHGMDCGRCGGSGELA